MLNRAKYVQQFANSMDRMFTTMASSALDLYNKEADVQANEALNKARPVITDKYQALVNNYNVSHDEMETVWANGDKELENLALEGVTNPRAKELVTKSLQSAYSTKQSEVVLASHQRRADNIIHGITSAVEMRIDNMSSSEAPEMVLRDVQRSLGFDNEGNPVNLAIPESQARALLQEARKEIYIRDAELSIDALIASDQSSVGTNGYGMALSYIDEMKENYTESDQKYLKQYALKEKNSQAAAKSGRSAEYAEEISN